MSSSKNPLAGKGHHRAIVQQLFEKSSPAAQKLLSEHLQKRRNRLRMEFKENKSRQKETDAYGEV